MKAASISAWQLLVTSATPTAIVCILASVGALLAHKGLLDAKGCQLVARLGFTVYTPALTFSKLTQAVSVGSIRHLWPLLANMTLSIIVGLGLGLLVSRALRTPPEFRTHALVAIAFGNVGNLPLVFVSTLCHDRRAVFYRSLGEECERLGVAYTAFDIAAATLWQFTLGINLIRHSAARAALAASAGQPGTPALSDDEDWPAGGLLPSAARLEKHPTVSDLLQGRRGSRPGSARSSPREPQAPLQPEPLAPRQRLTSSPLGAGQLLPPSPYSSSPQPGSRASSRQMQVVELQPQGAWAQGPGAQQQRGAWGQGSRAASEIEEEDTAALLAGPGGPGSRGRSAGAAGAAAAADLDGRSGGWLAHPASRAWQYLRGVDWRAAFPLPSQAAILGIACGCLPPVKGLLYGPHPPLRVLAEALDTLGSGLIPVALPLLGAVLYRGPGASRLPLRVTAGVLVTRLVLQPALLTGLVVVALQLGAFKPPDAMFLLTLLLSNATPTALNMQTLAVLFQHGEAEMSTILFWQYLASMATLPAFMRLFLWLIEAWV